jgi:dTDP-4-dehydrorhamnose reductase
MRVLILGAAGLLGSAFVRSMSGNSSFSVAGTVRDINSQRLFADHLSQSLLIVSDLTDPHQLAHVVYEIVPDVVINCVSANKRDWNDPSLMWRIFAELPKRAYEVCLERGIRFVQISSDGVFSGSRGSYLETDQPDAQDLYGKAKIAGEISGPGALTIRTSIFGPSLRGATGLLDWFLAQQGVCTGFPKSIFSGLPTTELVRVVSECLLNQPCLEGIFHVASEPISKMELLEKAAAKYKKKIRIVPDSSISIDRSLRADKFAKATGYLPRNWTALMDEMCDEEKLWDKNDYVYQ